MNGSTTTRRITYTMTGQSVALKVVVLGVSTTYYYLHSDHLGSTSLATTISGSLVSGSTSHYLPFGDWRTEPTAGLTDRGFTGHLHDNTGSNDIGLIYMNARYYLPYQPPLRVSFTSKGAKQTGARDKNLCALCVLCGKNSSESSL